MKHYKIVSKLEYQFNSTVLSKELPNQKSTMYALILKWFISISLCDKQKCLIVFISEQGRLEDYKHLHRLPQVPLYQDWSGRDRESTNNISGTLSETDMMKGRV